MVRSRRCVRRCTVLSAGAIFGFAILNIGSAPHALAETPAKRLVPSWTGFYLNGGGGYGFWTADTSTSRPTGGPPIPTLPQVQRQGGQGPVGRLGGGFDYQFNSRIVAGVFADFDFTDVKGTIQDSVVGLSADIRQTRSWSAGGRIGWLVTPEILTYVNVGYSSAHFSSSSMVGSRTGGAVAPGAVSGYVTPAFTKSGWMLGGGVETALSRGWFWRNEYRAAYYGNQAIQDLNSFSPNPTRRFNDINFKPQVHSFTTQIVYKFNSGSRAPFDSAPPARMPASWTGFHVDAGVGYGLWAADETTSAVPASLGEAQVLQPQRYGGKGWLGRFGGGFDYQFAPNFVAGVFSDFDVSSLKGTLSDSAAPVAGEIKQQWSWAVGARAGVLPTPDILIYLDGGYTNARFSSATMTDPSGGLFFAAATGNTPAFTAAGWFVGGGTEYALTALANGLSWRTEYRYAEYGKQTLVTTVSGIPPVVPVTQLNNINFEPAVQTVVTQLVYKFNGHR
jgi:outer membrane immunogenic protein